MPRRAGETPPEPSASLTPEERTALLASAAEITQTTQAKYVEAPNWIEAQPYLGLAGLTGYLSSPDLDERQSGHIRRVIAHQYLDLPQDIPKPKNTNAFLKAVRAEAGAEIRQARSFKGDVDKMPEEYAAAFEDVGRFEDMLFTDPLLLALAQSVRQRRRQR